MYCVLLLYVYRAAWKNVNSILDQDKKSLLIESNGPGTSWDRLDIEEADIFREYVKRLNPFKPSDRKAVKFNNKSIPRSLYSNLTVELIESFFTMKIKNMT